MSDTHKFTKEEIAGWYKKHIQPINPESNFDNGFRIILNTIRSNKLPEEESAVEQLAKKYSEYYQWWLSKFEDQERKFISKENQLKDFDSFFRTGMYKSKFGEQKDYLSDYLFGINGYPHAEKKLIEFQNLCASPWKKENGG